jgi:GTP-binding protein YchF
MKLGIIGISGVGKKTVFEALTKNTAGTAHSGEGRIGTIQVPDERVDILSKMYNPKKTIFAQVEYFLPGRKSSKKDPSIWNEVRDCDAFIHVVKNFKGFGEENPNPKANILELDQEMIFADLVVVEKRLERIELDKKRGKKINPEEQTLLQKCLKSLNDEIPLRNIPELAFAQVLRGFAFVSGKPILALFNNEDEDERIPDSVDFSETDDFMVIRGKLEHEISQMSQEEAEEFLAEFHITISAMDRVIKKSYEILGLISFFTVGEDEVRAWTIKNETQAVDSAEVIHSDIKKGFIRAEVVAYVDLLDAGNYQEAKKRANVRLEGKTYIVQDGDIINFRFNV